MINRFCQDGIAIAVTIGHLLRGADGDTLQTDDAVVSGGFQGA